MFVECTNFRDSEAPAKNTETRLSLINKHKAKQNDKNKKYKQPNGRQLSCRADNFQNVLNESSS